MSKQFLSTVLALVIAFAAFQTYMVYLNGKLADDAIRRELNKPPCASIPYTVGSRPVCLVLERRV